MIIHYLQRHFPANCSKGLKTSLNKGSGVEHSFALSTVDALNLAFHPSKMPTTDLLGYFVQLGVTLVGVKQADAGHMIYRSFKSAKFVQQTFDHALVDNRLYAEMSLVFGTGII